MSKRLVNLIEHVGYVNERGEHIYGTAALLHFLHTPIKSMNPKVIENGRMYVEKLLSA